VLAQMMPHPGGDVGCCASQVAGAAVGRYRPNDTGGTDEHGVRVRADDARVVALRDALQRLQTAVRASVGASTSAISPNRT
jgi:hypothetical protein